MSNSRGAERSFYFFKAGGSCRRPMTFIANAIMDPTSETLAGSTRVLLDLASSPNLPMYCSATQLDCFITTLNLGRFRDFAKSLRRGMGDGQDGRGGAFGLIDLCCFLASDALMTCCFTPSA